MKEAAVVQAAEEVATEKMAEQYAEEVRLRISLNRHHLVQILNHSGTQIGQPN